MLIGVHGAAMVHMLLAPPGAAALVQLVSADWAHSHHPNDYKTCAYALGNGYYEGVYEGRAVNATLAVELLWRWARGGGWWGWVRGGGSVGAGRGRCCTVTGMGLIWASGLQGPGPLCQVVAIARRVAVFFWVAAVVPTDRCPRCAVLPYCAAGRWTT